MTETEPKEETISSAPIGEDSTQNNAGDFNTESVENPFKGKRQKKKKKKAESVANEKQPNENENENENGDNVMPTPSPSKRQKKREKRLQIIVRNKDKELEKTVAYLSAWDTNHDEWKYEKLRQIYIQKNIFDENAIPDEHSEVAVRYLSTSKGHAREIIVKAAEVAMKEIEEKISVENRDELTSSAKYRRAREILQSMQE